MTKIEQKIPEGWSVKKLGECFKLSSGDYKPKDTSSCGEYPVFGGNGILGYSSRFNFSKNNLIIGRVGEYCGCVHRFYGNCWITDNALYVKEKLLQYSDNFMFFLLSHINLSRLRNKGGQPLISQQPIYIEKILLPPLAEQEKIAGILSCWDDGIEKLSALIEKKKTQKKALMQQLLTGKHRLKGFSTPWYEGKLGDILKERCEYTTINNQYPILTSSRKGIFKQEEYFDKQVASENNIGYKIIKQHDFTYRAMTDDDIFCFNELINESIGAVSPAYSVFYCSSISNVLLDAILNSKKFGANLIKVAQGGTRKSLKFSSLIKLKIFIPTDLAEQKAIAEILSKADEEIELLNKKLEAFKQEKKALMQQLLTGKIRVKVN